MTTLTTITACNEHAPHRASISEVTDVEYTFCETCENNIERYWIEDPDRLSWWSDWSISK